ncbi:MAG: triphosphoribosyl-dephospho-CoA synthase CitG [Hespellia sp.]|nr:triphosphoribosyl-dephospho-CoA synthase CitG [Hespellia sp.]MDD3404413.1 triphosphoribosyl-dephospho-CoA synthase CitG [Hespellia sp.]
MNVYETGNKLNISVSEISFAIGTLAKKAMLDEVFTTPKPGLVDCYSNGAHTDMDLRTFQKSADVITPYLIQMCETGAYSPKLIADTFAEIREIGMEAEKAMYQATGGVNTHKGMIFSMGIMAASAGYCISHGYQMTENTLFFLEQKLVRDTLLKEMRVLRETEQELQTTNGENLYRRTGIEGIRGEAVSGYESVRKHALPVFYRGMKDGRDYNCVKLQTLFSLMKWVQDSNIGSRRGEQTLEMVHRCADTFLKNGGAYQRDAVEQLKQMDAFFIVENISAGGCADLLAVTIFVYDLLQYKF